MAVAVIVGATAFVSCDDDDDKDFKPGAGGADKVVGVYSGPISAKVMNIECKIEGTYDFSIQKQEDDEVIVTIPSCTYVTEQMSTGGTIPQLVIRDVDVDRTGVHADKYILEEDEFSIVVDGVRYSGAIYGVVDGSSIELSYQITPGQMPMPINFSFSGTRKN